MCQACQQEIQFVLDSHWLFIVNVLGASCKGVHNKLQRLSNMLENIGVSTFAQRGRTQQVVIKLVVYF